MFGRLKVLLFGFCVCSSAHALLDVELTRGAMASAEIEVDATSLTQPYSKEFVKVFLDDINITGRLKAQSSATQKSIADYKVTFKQRQNGNKVQWCMLMGLAGSQGKKKHESLLCQVVANGQWRGEVHRFAQAINRRLLSSDGPFLRTLGYVRESRLGDKKHYTLEISDYDGGRMQVLKRSFAPITSLSFSPDGKRLAYVSFEGHKALLQIHTLATGDVQVFERFPGANGVVSWSPSGKKLAMSLSISGVMQLYVMDLESKQIQKVTSHGGIEVDPTWSVDGKYLYFASEMAEGVQVCRAQVASGRVERITQHGRYNVSPSLDAKEEKLVYLSRVDGRLQAVLQEMPSGRVSLLGTGKLDDAPVISEDGEHVLFASSVGTKRVVQLRNLVSGELHRLPLMTGGIRHLVWVK